MRLRTAQPAIQLTPRQLQLLQMVARFQENRCYSPTLAEMACELDISRSTVFEHLAELRKKGLLSKYQNKARSLKVSSQGQELLSELSGQCSSTYATEDAGIPLAGSVAAGVPVEAVENIESLSLTSAFGSSDNIFALEVAGDSMIDEDIRQGDYVICRRSCVAHDGQLVVAIVDDENATLKRFYKEKDRARLQPANDDYQPIYTDNCRIEAVVIGLVRKL
ncbi:MAG TPA: transcriptional repressor LexA [Sedimentisphaerales bacterium]|nr:transcriptional repressor LexA [Sedimentisphaerales bacterium]